MNQMHHFKRRQESMPDYISVISSRKCAKIRIDEIEIIEQDGRKLHVITEGRDYTFYGNLNMIAESLAERAFFRPIKSVIINLDHIKDIGGYSVNFNSGQSLAMGKNALAVTRKAYKRYLLRYPPYSLWDPVVAAESFVAEELEQLAMISEGSVCEFGNEIIN